jgi:hypothetical protein
MQKFNSVKIRGYKLVQAKNGQAVSDGNKMVKHGGASRDRTASVG